MTTPLSSPDPQKSPPPKWICTLAEFFSPLLSIASRILGTRYFEPIEFIQFCCVGVANTLVDFFVFLPLSYVLPLPVARIFSWVAACTFSYFSNKIWVFHAQTEGPASVIRFVAINLLGLALGLATLKLFMFWGWGRIVAYLVTLPAIALGNYFGYKLWSFKH